MASAGVEVGQEQAPTAVVPLKDEGVSRRKLAGAAAVIALGNVLSRGLGLAREQVIAATFGASAGTDAYVMARTLPLILYDLLVGSVITAAFVPVFVQHTRTPRDLWRLVSAIFSLATLVFAAIAVLLAVFAEPLLSVIAPAWPVDQQRLAADLMRIALASVVFQGLAGVLTSVLYAQDRFTLPAFANATYNAGIIVGIVLLAPVLGLQALVYGLVLGAIGQFALQAAGLRAFWRSFRPRIDLRDPAVRRVLALYGTVAAGLLVTVVGQLIDRNLASHLPAGSISSMQYATTLIQFPLGMVGLATSYAVLPTLSRYAGGAEESAEWYRDALLFGMKVILLLMLPALAGLAALATPLVALLFERGAFTPADTTLTASVFLAYAPMLPLTALDYLLINAFYARQDPRTPVLVGVAGVALYLVVALTLIQPLGVIGLALANATQNSAHAVVLLVLLTRAMPRMRLGQALAPFLARVIPSTLVMGGAVLAAWPLLAHAGRFGGVVLAIGLGGLLYAALLHLLGVPEARGAVGLVRARLRH